MKRRLIFDMCLFFTFSTNEKHKSQEMNENSKKQLLNKNKIVKQLIIQNKMVYFTTTLQKEIT